MLPTEDILLLSEDLCPGRSLPPPQQLTQGWDSRKPLLKLGQKQKTMLEATYHKTTANVQSWQIIETEGRQVLAGAGGGGVKANGDAVSPRGGENVLELGRGGDGCATLRRHSKPLTVHLQVVKRAKSKVRTVWPQHPSQATSQALAHSSAGRKSRIHSTEPLRPGDNRLTHIEEGRAQTQARSLRPGPNPLCHFLAM